MPSDVYKRQVYENMAFGLKVHKTPAAEIQRRVREAADILEIGHLLDLSLIHI